MDKPKQEKRRKRKKRLLTAIREQIEFYFSDANLRHDRYMRQLVGADDPQAMGQNAVDLNEFFKFNKISQMTQRVLDISLALEASKCLSLVANELKVKRSQPFVNKDNNFADNSTIYVERLPPNADHNWIRSVFGGFGRIDYIRIPHFKHNNNIMGFAFIEFSQPEEAEKAVKHFIQYSAANQKTSQKTGDPPSDQNGGDITVSELSQPNDGNVSDNTSHKRPHEVEADDEVVAKKSKISDETHCSDKEMETKDNNVTTKVSKKKKKRKRKRKAVMNGAQEENPEVINLRVMSKKEWKQWKNQYLKLQKQTMTAIKKSLLVESNKSDAELPKKENDVSEDRSFETGLIIKLKFAIPSIDLNEQKFKQNIRLIGAKSDIQYIDLPMSQMKFNADNQTVDGICYVRTNSSDDCQTLVSNEKFKQLGESSVLEGIEESDYWNQIYEQRIKKKSNSDESVRRSKNKERGFDKIISRVESFRTNVGVKLNKHIKFDENP